MAALVKDAEYGDRPDQIGQFREVELAELQTGLYLPVKMKGDGRVELPYRLRPVRPLVDAVLDDIVKLGVDPDDVYVYVCAKHGYATPENPLNRPGWHCDGFGTDDLNYVWWAGAGTRFYVHGGFDQTLIPDNHVSSLERFEELAAAAAASGNRRGSILSLPGRTLYRLHPKVIHATPIIEPPGEMRSFVKISVSTERYNLLGNAHNDAFDYEWVMWPRSTIRNDPRRAQADFYVPDGAAT